MLVNFGKWKDEFIQYVGAGTKPSQSDGSASQENCPKGIGAQGRSEPEGRKAPA